MDVMTDDVVCPVCEQAVPPLPNYKVMRDLGMCRQCAARAAAYSVREMYRPARAAQELRWPTMRADDVASVLGISTVNLRQLVHRGQIEPKGRAGKWSYYDTDDVLELCLRRGVTLVHTPNSHTDPE